VGYGDLIEPLNIDRYNPAVIQHVMLAIRVAAGEAGIWAYDGAYANINFTVNGAAGSATELTVDSFLVNGGKVETNVENGRITVESAANNGSRGVSGRLVTIDGAGLRNAAVIITDSQGRQARVTSTSFGWFRFDGLSTGETYTLRVDSKHYSFQQRTFTIGDGFMSLGNIVADK